MKGKDENVVEETKVRVESRREREIQIGHKAVGQRRHNGEKKPSEAQRSKSIIICKHNEMGREVARLAQEVTINQCCPVLRFLCAAIGH